MTGTSDLALRCVWINLEYFDEFLTTRTFHHPDLVAHVRQHRRRYISALVSMVKAWADEGRPEGKYSMPTFDRWARTVGGILDAVVVKGFLKDIEKQSEELDSEGAELKALLPFWKERFGPGTVTAKDLLSLARERELFSWIVNDEVRRFSKMLNQYRNRILGDWQIIEPHKMRPARFALKAVNRP